jgi:hypothetical protein
MRRTTVLRAFGSGVAIVASLGLSGCVALPLLAPAAATAGGDLVKAGTVRTFGGATFRTFSVSVSDLYRATRKTLDDLGFGPPQEESVDERVTMYAYGIDRTVRIDLTPITGGLTEMRVFVRKGNLGKDLATSSEFVQQIENTLESQVAQRQNPRRIGSRR